MLSKSFKIRLSAALLANLVCFHVCADSSISIATTGVLKNDPAKVIGADACTKCHGQELSVWRQTSHFKTYSELQRQPAAEQIAKKMGLRSIKRGDLCIQCHYTMQQKGTREKAIAGVSCESCHGAALDWLAIHNDYGGPTATKESESAEHRRQRLSESIQLGMRNPANVYLIAQGCYGCHMVPHESLVNVGGHKAGSEDFELVAWSQGTLRHNFQRTDGQLNASSSDERLRAMYVVGMIAKLEYSIRATSAATERATYGFASARRAYEVRRELAELQETVSHPQLDQILQIAYGIRLKTNNQSELLDAADQIRALAFEFAAIAQDIDLSAVDELLPAESAYK